MRVRIRLDAYFKACRARGWLTVTAQAQQLGMPRWTLHRILAHTQTPTLQRSFQMAEQLGLRVDQLFEAVASQDRPA